MRGFVLGLLLLFGVALSVLSLRPGGLRNQLRNVARRFKIALALVGVFLVVSGVLRLAVRDPNASTWATAGLGAALGVVFVVLAQERQLE
jgi:hypothetical protein